MLAHQTRKGRVGRLVETPHAGWMDVWRSAFSGRTTKWKNAVFPHLLRKEFFLPKGLRDYPVKTSPPNGTYFKASVLMERLSYPTATVLSNEITRNRKVL